MATATPISELQTEDALFVDWAAGRIGSRAALATYMCLHRLLDEPDLIGMLDNWQRQQRQMAADADLEAELAEWNEEPRW